MGNLPTIRRPEGGGAVVETSHAVDVFDRANPRSVINLLPDRMQAMIYNCLSERRDFFAMDERTLKKATKPTPTDNRLRIAFWTEYNRAQDALDKMRVEPIYAGICTAQNFYDRYLTSPANVAWMLTPPTNYVVAMEEILVHGQDRIREILDMELIDEKGKFDANLGKLIFQIYQHFETKKYGATVQRTEIRGEIKNLNVNVDATPAPTPGQVQAASAVSQVTKIESMEEIQAKLEKLRRNKATREEAMKGPKPDIEVEPMPAEGAIGDSRDESASSEDG